MAILTPGELAKLRAAIQASSPLPYTKPIINAGEQAAEDWWVSTGKTAIRDAVKTAMIAAGAPGATNAEATQIAKAWLRDKFDRGG